ncbi:hypothetical protein HYC85_011962, partial [Camellia sinensis]
EILTRLPKATCPLSPKLPRLGNLGTIGEGYFVSTPARPIKDRPLLTMISSFENITRKVAAALPRNDGMMHARFVSPGNPYISTGLWLTLLGTSFSSPGLDGLKHIQDLYLDYSFIDKSFLYNVGVMFSQKVLTLRIVRLNGSLPDEGWSKLSNLQELDLSENGFNETLPSCFGYLTSIRLLDLSSNQFTENLAVSPLIILTTLEYLFLSYNHFEIPPSFVSFFNYSKLKVFSLSNCGSYKLDMKLPQFLFYQYDLRIVDLSNNILVGMFPIWLLKNNTRLEVLTLRKCCLIGLFLLPSCPNPYVSSIDIFDNHLEGPIPTNIGLIFPNLLNLNMSRNLFEGYIPTTLGDMHSLEILDLSTNNFSGQIPEHLPTSLGFLKLSNNNLYGQISLLFVNLTLLVYLYLDNNYFVQKIPNNMSFPRHLVSIGISNNLMSGKLPRWMRNMPYLIGITMFSINLEGPIPIELCKLDVLEFIDLSENKLEPHLFSLHRSPSPLLLKFVGHRHRLKSPSPPSQYEQFYGFDVVNGFAYSMV